MYWMSTPKQERAWQLKSDSADERWTMNIACDGLGSSKRATKELLIMIKKQ